MQFDATALAACFGIVENDNVRSTIKGLEIRGRIAGLDRPERLAQFLAQLAHESALWRYDREIWGPTPAQRRYDRRTDLGNTPEADGDGYKYRGRGPIQITGRDNYAAFTYWAKKFDAIAPDFIMHPDLVNTDPWEGLGPVWYWESRNLNKYASTGNLEMVTRRINGGLNGFSDRLRRYDECALWFLRFSTIRSFQVAQSLVVDGISGPATRAAMHAELSKLPAVTFEQPEDVAPKLMELLSYIVSLLFGGRKNAKNIQA